MSVVEAAVEQFKSFLETNASLKINDQTQKEYLTKLAETYFNEDLKQKDLLQYLKDANMEQSAFTQVITKFNQLKEKIKILKPPKPVQQAKPAVATTKPKPEKKVEQKKTEEKSKIFDRIQDGQAGRKKIKTQKVQQGKKSPKKQSQDEAKEQQAAKKNGLKQQVQSSGKKKCRFFPFCRSMETGDCPFFHPTDKCTYFPHCKYGQECLYVHEACKFKETCKKASCPYAHPFRKNNNNIAMALQALIKNQNPLKTSRKPKQPRKQRPEQN